MSQLYQRKARGQGGYAVVSGCIRHLPPAAVVVSRALRRWKLATVASNKDIRRPIFQLLSTLSIHLDNKERARQERLLPRAARSTNVFVDTDTRPSTPSRPDDAVRGSKRNPASHAVTESRSSAARSLASKILSPFHMLCGSGSSVRAPQPDVTRRWHCGITHPRRPIMGSPGHTAAGGLGPADAISHRGSSRHPHPNAGGMPTVPGKMSPVRCNGRHEAPGLLKRHGGCCNRSGQHSLSYHCVESVRSQSEC